MSRQVYTDGVLREQWDDATQTYTSWDAQGNVTTSRPYNAFEVAAMNSEIGSGNLGALRQKAQTALTGNATYLAIASPTNAQAVTQVGALTRQIDGIIRVLNGLTSTITDS